MKNALFAACAPLALLSAAAAQEDGQDVIVVTASPLDRTQDELLSGASVLDGDDLARQGVITIGETLRKEPGLSETAFGAGASRPIIRGLGGDRVRILTNGIGSIDAAAASPDHAVAVEPATAERIEVVRGTGLLRYGSSAAGGVVNVIDGRLPSAVPEDGLDGAVTVRGTSVDDGVQVAGGVTGKVADIGAMELVLHASGSWSEAEDYDIPGFAESAAVRAEEEAEEEEGEEHSEEEEVFGTLENSFVETENASFGASLIGEKGFFAVSVSETGTEYGVPGGHGHGHEEEGEEEGEEHSEEEGVFIVLDQTRFDLNAERLFDSGPFEKLSVFGGIADYEHTEFEGPGEPGTVFTNEGYELRIEALQMERDGWRGATGIQLRDREFSAIGEEAFVPPTETIQWGLYTFQELRTGPWHLEAGARFETTDHERSTDGFELDFEGISGSVGAGYELNPNFNLAVSAFRTERAPTTEELFSDGPHLATDQYELGDEDLDIETATGIEGLIHLHDEKGAITLNLFYTDYDDFIYERETGLFGDAILLAQGEDDPEELEEFGELPVFQFTAADARFKGFELFGEYELAAWDGGALSVDGVLDYVDAEISGGENLPRIPPLGLTAGVEADWDRFSLRAEAEHNGSQDDTARFERPTDEFTLLNLYASAELVQGLTLRVAGLNLGDEEARVHSSFLKDDVPLPGRNVRVSLTYDF